MVRLSADKPGAIDFDARLEAGHDNPQTTVVDNRTLAVGAVVQEDGIRYEARLRVRNEGGSVDVSDKGVKVRDADSVTLLVDRGDELRQLPRSLRRSGKAKRRDTRCRA